MCAVLVGGMDRLKRDYITAASAKGVQLKVFTGQERSLKSQLGELDLMILCTSKVSHAARNEVLRYAKANNIPVQMIHSSGVSSVKKCLQ